LKSAGAAISRYSMFHIAPDHNRRARGFAGVIG
jgi:hypothetical protein